MQVTVSVPNLINKSKEQNLLFFRDYKDWLILQLVDGLQDCNLFTYYDLQLLLS